MKNLFLQPFSFSVFWPQDAAVRPPKKKRMKNSQWLSVSMR